MRSRSVSIFPAGWKGRLRIQGNAMSENGRAVQLERFGVIADEAEIIEVIRVSVALIDHGVAQAHGNDIVLRSWTVVVWSVDQGVVIASEARRRWFRGNAFTSARTVAKCGRCVHYTLVQWRP